MYYYKKDDKGNITMYSQSDTYKHCFDGWEKTEDEIIQLCSGALAFKKNIDLLQEEKNQAERDRKDKINEEIVKLKKKLGETDYKCLKFIDGELSAEEYEEIKMRRKELRKEINRLENVG